MYILVQEKSTGYEGYVGFIMAAHHETHSSVWYVTVGPDKNVFDKYADGMTADGRPYYLQHCLYNTKQQAENAIRWPHW